MSATSGVGSSKTLAALERRRERLATRCREAPARGGLSYDQAELRALMHALAAVRLYRAEALHGAPTTEELLRLAAVTILGAGLGSEGGTLATALSERAREIEVLRDAD